MKKIFSILALLLMAVTGAWAQTETLLTTITPTGQTTYSETTPGAVTVTQNCEYYKSGYGWVFDQKTGSVTVEANEGYTISKCVFTLSNGSTKTLTISTPPFKINFVWGDDIGGCYCEGTDQDYIYHGVKSIQVYGYAPTTVAITGITLSQTEAAMTVGGDALTLTATVAPDGATDKTVTWTTSDASVATVANGVVTAVAAGTATITATATNGTAATSDDKTATCTVTVSNPALTLSETTDNSTALSTANGKVCNVTLTRTLQKGGYNTFAVPFAISSAKMTELGITAKKLTASDFNSTTGTLTLTFSSASEIEAGKPYLVKVSANVVNPTFSGVTVSSTAVPNTETTAVNFVPTLGKALVTGDGSYASEPGSVLFLGSGNKLFSPTVVNDAGQEASYMKGFRAYFQLKGTAASARAFNIDFGDGETTGIISVNGSGLMFNSSDGCYDLLGRRIEGQPTQKGVYIVNGKKTVIK